MTPEKASRRHAERAASTVSADNINLNLRRSQVSVKLAEMIIENLADDPSKQMFEWCWEEYGLKKAGSSEWKQKQTSSQPYCLHRLKADVEWVLLAIVPEAANLFHPISPGFSHIRFSHISMRLLATPTERMTAMFDLDAMQSASALDDIGFNVGAGCEATPSVDLHLTDGSHSISFGRTGDASFDDLMDRVDQFNAETRQLTELARQEVAAKTAVHDASSAASSTYTYNTGDPHLDNLLNDAYREMSEYRTLADQARMELGPGKYLSIDDAINQGGSQGLSDFIQQRLEWMEHATPEQLRQYEHQVNWQHEVEMLRLHENDILHEQSDLAKQFIKHQTKEQFDAEKAGYHQVNPWSPYRLYTGDPNIFEKDGELYRLIPGTGGTMERIDV